MVPAKLETEARCRITWGESPREVLAYLEENGVSHQDATELLATLQEERRGALREVGRRKILLGAALILVPFAAWITFQTIGVIFVKLFGVAIFVGLVGAWKIIDGLMHILAPGGERGDLSDKSE